MDTSASHLPLPASADTTRAQAQTIAIVATCLGLFVACGIGPSNRAPRSQAPPSLTVSLSVNSMVFPSVAVGSQSQPLQLMISNVDTQPVSYVASLPASLRKEFVVDDAACRPVVQPDQNCTVSLIYRPSFVGNLSSRLLIYINGHPGPSVVVEATAVSAAPPK